MLKHVVMWTLKDNALGENREINASKMKVLLEDLVTKVNEVEEIEVGININNTEAAYDVVLLSTFKNEEDLSIYQVHPEHVKVVNFIKSVTEKRVVVDYLV